MEEEEPKVVLKVVAEAEALVVHSEAEVYLVKI